MDDKARSILVVTGTCTAACGCEPWARRWISRAIARKHPSKVIINLWSGLDGIAWWTLDVARHESTATVYGYGASGMAFRYDGGHTWTHTGPWTRLRDGEQSASPAKIDAAMVDHAREQDPEAYVLMLRARNEDEEWTRAMHSLVSKVHEINRLRGGMKVTPIAEELFLERKVMSTITHTFG